MKKSSFLLVSLVILFGLRAYGFFHCEIPCGIYNDEMRFEIIRFAMQEMIHEIINQPSKYQ